MRPRPTRPISIVHSPGEAYRHDQIAVLRVAQAVGRPSVSSLPSGSTLAPVSTAGFVVVVK
jgi:hypothetical protein